MVYILEVSVSNCYRKTAYSDWGFSWSS